MRVIGITGGIGSGKSTVSKILSGFGAKVIEADEIAKGIMVKGEKAFSEVVDYFGDQILDLSGQIDRKKLASIVFVDKDKLNALNQITHKYVSVNILKLIDKYKDEKTVVVDAAIPIKKGFIDVSDEIWVVTANKELRIKRVMKRSGLTYSEVLERINSQLEDDYYLSISDIIIYNDGTYEELENKVINIYNRW
ncbi:UNVERIFIED_CONTAM: dephospho-CoA kinase [Acetivibrio alkalicellulosi]